MSSMFTACIFCYSANIFSSFRLLSGTLSFFFTELNFKESIFAYLLSGAFVG